MNAEPRWSGPDAGEVSRMLADNIERLAAELLPAGRRSGSELRVGSVANEPGTSLRVMLRGKPGAWSDFATGETGDALDLVAAVRYRGCRKRAYAWSLGWLGLSGATRPDLVAAYVPPRDPALAVAAEEASRERYALRLYLEAQPALSGTPADAYLMARGIDLRRLGRQPRALRFHPACQCAEASAKLPALIAAISDQAGRHVATHRTWLTEIRGTWRKAPLADPKKSVGKLRGGTIRLWRGESARRLVDAVPGSCAVLGEGIETCLSVAIACPDLRVLCAISLGNMASIDLPDAIGTIVLLADNDGEKPGARDALQRAINRFIEQGRDVRLARSPIGKDFNDCVRVA